MASGRPASTIDVMPANSDPRRRQDLRVVLDEHERERSDLAHELHEQVAQSLAAVLLGLDSLGMDDGSEKDLSKIAALRESVAETLEHCRALAVSLRPPLLDQLGLAPALKRLSERAGAESASVDPALAEAALGPALETEVYRSVEEALGRVSGPSLTVSLDHSARELRASVRSRDGTPQGGDLGALEARLELVGGTLTAGGDELVMRLPMGPGNLPRTAAFPQAQHVETPDGGRRSLA